MKPTAVQALRQYALCLADVDEGVACPGTALESRTVRRNGKTFLFLRATQVRLKLASSLKEAADLAAMAPDRFSVGANGWVLVKLDGAAPPLDVLQRWIAESHALLGAGKASAKAKPATSPPKRKSSKRR
jgi:hypothetical protein